MNHKSTLNLDALIKKIYSSYIDIKSGDFRELDKDILLADIQALYSAIKALYPNNNSAIHEIEQDIMDSKSEIEVTPPIEETVEEEIEIPKIEDEFEEPSIEIVEEKSTTSEPISTPAVEKEEIAIPPNPIISETKVNNEIDLTMFDDHDHIEENIITDVKSTFTASNPIVESFTDKKEEVKLPEPKVEIVEAPKVELKDFSNVPDLSIIEPKPEKRIESPVDIEIEKKKPISELPNLEKSKEKIMDFLHEEPSQQRDIYSLLDINTRIGLIELFFQGDAGELTNCMVNINKQKTKEDCLKIINGYASKYQISNESDIFQTFIQLIDRKFQYL